MTAQGRSEQELVEPPGEMELRGSGGPAQGVWVINDLASLGAAAQPPPGEGAEHCPCWSAGGRSVVVLGSPEQSER